MINLVGAGGHSLVVIDSLLAGGWSLEHICLWDEDVSRTTSKRLDIQVRLFDPSLLSGQPYHVCIGNSKARANLVECLELEGRIHSVYLSSGDLYCWQCKNRSGDFSSFWSHSWASGTYRPKRHRESWRRRRSRVHCG
ncbi:hypothetical protein ACHMW9_25630 [Mesorhizobium terrae]